VPAPKYSILLIGFRSLRFLEGCFESVLKSPGPDFEVLFLDNDSPDPEAEWVEANVHDARVRVFRSDINRYFAGGVNLLAAEAKGEYLILLNPDTKVEPDWLEVLDACLKSGYDAAQADLRSLEDPDRRESRGHFLDRLGFIVHAPPSDPSSIKTGSAADYPAIFAGRGAGLALRRTVFEEAGGMDESFKMYFEETDLCWRVNLLGYRIGYAPGAVIYHLKGGSSSPAFFQWNQYRFLRNRISSMLANYGARSLVFVLPPHLLLCWAGVLGRLLRLRVGLALTEAAALVSPWFILGTTLAKRRRVQSIRRITDGELLERGVILRGLKLFGSAAPPR
jgi:GT2 family glycosyltransferase